MVILNKLEKSINIFIKIMIFLYFCMYLMPMGVYDAANYVREKDGNGFFDDDRYVALLFIGIGCTIAIALYYTIRKNSIIKYTIVLILCLIHIPIMNIGKGIVFEIARYVAAYEGTYEIIMSGSGKILYVGIVILNCIVLILAAIRIVTALFCKADEEEFFGNKQDYLVKIQTINDTFMLIMLISGFILNFITALLGIYGFGFISYGVGILLPGVMYVFMVMNLWITKRKWHLIVIHYILIIYYIYNMLFSLFRISMGVMLEEMGLDLHIVFVVLACIVIGVAIVTLVREIKGYHKLKQ